MSNNYKATKTQMLMKKARRYNINVDRLVEKLKSHDISEESFTGALASLVKKCEISKNSYARNNVIGR